MSTLTKEEYFKKYKEEEVEESKDQYVNTGYPVPVTRFRLVFESFKVSIEENYYWLLNALHYDAGGYPHIEKITDVFAAAEHSAFWGVAQTRLGIQQDKVSQFLAVIGKMVKELFQLVREIRIIDERLSYYKDSYTKSKSHKSAEITLKGIYIDMVEGASKNPASVYGLARELQFTTLPDLFFSIHPQTSKDVDVEVDKLDFNRKVKEVLARKLRSFLEWKEHTYKEMTNRRVFTIKFLRQHFDVIKMYMSWIRPYLRNIRRIQDERMEQQKDSNPNLVSAFEGSLMEIEFLTKKIPQGNKDIYSCVLMNFKYRTRPSMNYMQEGYQRGPLHVGELKITWRGYTWSEEDIENYKNMRNQEDFELLGLIDSSVKAAMESLGSELERYLNEAGEDYKFDKGKKKKQPDLPGMADPLTSVFKGFGEMFAGAIPSKKNDDKFRLGNEVSNAKSEVKKSCWNTYKNYKKSHRMVAW